jgi:hypothetical protein
MTEFSFAVEFLPKPKRSPAGFIESDEHSTSALDQKTSRFPAPSALKLDTGGAARMIARCRNIDPVWTNKLLATFFGAVGSGYFFTKGSDHGGRAIH